MPLAALSRAEAVAPAVAEALRLNLSAVMEPEAQLFAYLGGKQLLLVLDNFDQLIAPQERGTGLSGEHAHDGTAFLSGLLRSAPRVVVLVTSRERLNLQEEWAYAVQWQRLTNEEQRALSKLSVFQGTMSLVCKVEDMTCGGCAASIKQALSYVPGVSSVEANPTSKDVLVDTSSNVSRKTIVTAIKGAGYTEITDAQA